MGGPHNEITTSCKEMGAVTTLFRLFLQRHNFEVFQQNRRKAVMSWSGRKRQSAVETGNAEADVQLPESALLPFPKSRQMAEEPKSKSGPVRSGGERQRAGFEASRRLSQPDQKDLPG